MSQNNKIQNQAEKMTILASPGYSDCRTRVLGMLDMYGFAYNLCSTEAPLERIIAECNKTRLVMIFDPQNGNEGNILSCVLNSVLDENRYAVSINVRYADFAENFLDRDSFVRVIYRENDERYMVDELLVGCICRFSEYFIPENCRGKFEGTIKTAISAYSGNTTDMLKVGDSYRRGEALEQSYEKAYRWYSMAKDAGDAEGALRCGRCLQDGIGVEMDPALALELFRMAAVTNPEATYYVGESLYFGTGVEKDVVGAREMFARCTSFRELGGKACYMIGCIDRDAGKLRSALSYFERAADAGMTAASAELAKIYCEPGECQNFEKGYKYATLAADAGVGRGAYYEGLCHLNGYGCAKDEAAAFDCFLSGSSDSDAECTYILGACYEQGIGCKKDLSWAITCYKRASDLGYIEANNNLAGCYLVGIDGVSQPEKALFYLERGAELGDANAVCRLGLCALEGNIFPRDEKRAVEYFERAACMDSPAGMYHLGLCLRDGIGTAADVRRAYKYFEMAAQKNFLPAIYEQAQMLSSGIGAGQDTQYAYELFCRAADMGMIRAMLDAGNCSFGGVGTVRNYAQAYSYFSRAVEKYSLSRGTEGIEGMSESDKSAFGDAFYRLGICHLFGYGTNESREQAMKHFKTSAKLGCADAAYMVGELYTFSNDKESKSENAEKALKYYVYAANHACNRARVVLAESYAASKKFTHAYNLYKKAADSGLCEAMYNVGKYLTSGVGTDPNAELGRTYFLRASLKHYAPAMLVLGMMSENGRGTERNISEAKQYYTDAINASGEEIVYPHELTERKKICQAEIDDARVTAEYRLGMLMAKNPDTATDFSDAFLHIATAASYGEEHAQAEIAGLYANKFKVEEYFRDRLYANRTTPSDEELAFAMNALGNEWYIGRGVLRTDEFAAVRCYRISARLGNNDSKYTLGWCLRYGKGTNKDVKEAVKLLKESADNGNINAAYSYALCCEEGAAEGYKDIHNAIIYYRKAHLAGHKEATKSYHRLIEK